MKSKIKKLSWVLYGQGGRLIFQTAYFLILAFLLGPDDYGIYITISALIIILSPFCGLGFTSLIVKVIRTDEGNFRNAFGNALNIILFSFLFLLGIGLGIIFIFFDNPLFASKLFLWLAISDLFFLKLNELSAQIFIARDKVKFAAHIQNFISLVRLLSVMVFFFITHYIGQASMIMDWAYLYCLLSGLLAVFVFIFTIFQEASPNLRAKIIPSYIKEGVFFSIGLSSQGVYNDVDKTILGKYSTNAVTGYYGFAYKILDVLFIPIKAVLMLTFPKFFEIGKQGGVKSTAKYAMKILLPLSFYCLITTLVAFLFIPTILSVVLDGKYENSGEYIVWLLPIVFLRVIHYVFADALTGAGFQKERSIVQVTVAIINFGLNILFIKFYGVYGAIMVSIISDTLMSILIIYLIISKIKNNRRLKVGMK
ncbi:oligosaccharide flippase family protein [Bacillus sp. CMF21]|nr:oligosaccharide flippase family protein [Bacillus sp. CMF21]